MDKWRSITLCGNNWKAKGSGSQRFRVPGRDPGICTSSADTHQLNEHSMGWSDPRATDWRWRAPVAAILDRNCGKAS